MTDPIQQLQNPTQSEPGLPLTTLPPPAPIVNASPPTPTPTPLVSPPPPILPTLTNDTPVEARVMEPSGLVPADMLNAISENETARAVFKGQQDIANLEFGGNNAALYPQLYDIPDLTQLSATFNNNSAAAIGQLRATQQVSQQEAQVAQSLLEQLRRIPAPQGGSTSDGFDWVRTILGRTKDGSRTYVGPATLNPKTGEWEGTPIGGILYGLGIIQNTTVGAVLDVAQVINNLGGFTRDWIRSFAPPWSDKNKLAERANPPAQAGLIDNPYFDGKSNIVEALRGAQYSFGDKADEGGFGIGVDAGSFRVGNKPGKGFGFDVNPSVLVGFGLDVLTGGVIDSAVMKGAAKLGPAAESVAQVLTVSPSGQPKPKPSIEAETPTTIQSELKTPFPPKTKPDAKQLPPYEPVPTEGLFIPKSSPDYRRYLEETRRILFPGTEGDQLPLPLVIPPSLGRTAKTPKIKLPAVKQTKAPKPQPVQQLVLPIDQMRTEFVDAEKVATKYRVYNQRRAIQELNAAQNAAIAAKEAKLPLLSRADMKLWREGKLPTFVPPELPRIEMPALPRLESKRAQKASKEATTQQSQAQAVTKEVEQLSLLTPQQSETVAKRTNKTKEASLLFAPEPEARVPVNAPGLPQIKMKLPALKKGEKLSYAQRTAREILEAGTALSPNTQPAVIREFNKLVRAANPIDGPVKADLTAQIRTPLRGDVERGWVKKDQYSVTQILAKTPQGEIVQFSTKPVIREAIDTSPPTQRLGESLGDGTFRGRVGLEVPPPSYGTPYLQPDATLPNVAVEKLTPKSSEAARLPVPTGITEEALPSVPGKEFLRNPGSGELITGRQTATGGDFLFKPLDELGAPPSKLESPEWTVPGSASNLAESLPTLTDASGQQLLRLDYAGRPDLVVPTPKVEAPEISVDAMLATQEVARAKQLVLPGFDILPEALPPNVSLPKFIRTPKIEMPVIDPGNLKFITEGQVTVKGDPISSAVAKARLIRNAEASIKKQMEAILSDADTLPDIGRKFTTEVDLRPLASTVQDTDGKVVLPITPKVTRSVFHGTRVNNLEIPSINPTMGAARSELGVGLYVTPIKSIAENAAQAGVNINLPPLPGRTLNPEKGFVHELQINKLRLADADAESTAVVDIFNAVKPAFPEISISYSGGTAISLKKLFDDVAVDIPDETVLREFQRHVAETLKFNGYQGVKSGDVIAIYDPRTIKTAGIDEITNKGIVSPLELQGRRLATETTSAPSLTSVVNVAEQRVRWLSEAKQEVLNQLPAVKAEVSDAIEQLGLFRHPNVDDMSITPTSAERLAKQVGDVSDIIVDGKKLIDTPNLPPSLEDDILSVLMESSDRYRVPPQDEIASITDEMMEVFSSWEQGYTHIPLEELSKSKAPIQLPTLDDEMMRVVSQWENGSRYEVVDIGGVPTKTDFNRDFEKLVSSEAPDTLVDNTAKAVAAVKEGGNDVVARRIAQKQTLSPEEFIKHSPRLRSEANQKIMKWMWDSFDDIQKAMIVVSKPNVAKKFSVGDEELNTLRTLYKEMTETLNAKELASVLEEPASLNLSRKPNGCGF